MSAVGHQLQLTIKPFLFQLTVGTILSVVKQRVEALMAKFDENRFKSERVATIRKYHDDVLADRRAHELNVVPETSTSTAMAFVQM